MAESKLFIDPEPVLKNSHWGLTKFDVKMFSFRWNIQHFMSLPKKTGEWCEIHFQTGDESAAYWFLRVYPNGKDANRKDFVSVNLCNLSSKNTVKMGYSMELRDSSDNMIVSRNHEYLEFPPNTEHGFSDCIKRETLQKALEKSINGTLTILCTIKQFTDIKNIEGPTNRPIQKPEETLSTHVLKALLRDQAFSDFTVNVKERQFKVHKAILHTCSPVFAKMLSIEMKEREKNETTVDDVEADVFEKIVEFMYTGTVATINTYAMELVPVAHKYDLKGLLEQCEAVLSSQISTDLAVKLLVLSNVYSLEYLKEVTVKYMKANLNGVSQTADWKAHVENDPKLLMLLLVP